MLIITSAGFAQTPLTFKQIPLTDPDIVAPGRGAEEWMVLNQVNVPVEGVNTQPLDAYYRFEWTSIEKGKGVYDWAAVDAAFKRAIDKGQKFSFGIMPMCSNCTGTLINNAKLSYPLYLHNEMQGQADKDWVYNGYWVPNWNSNYFLTAWENMLKAVAAHINNTSINGIKLSSIVSYVDIRGYGNWGEWHNYSYGNNEPAANKATAASLIRIVNAHKNAFPDTRLVALSDAFDTGNWSDVPAEVGHYLLTATNNVGQFGWRRDNWGDPASWYRDKLENNNTSFNGQVFKDLIMNKWKYAPIVGEPSSCCTVNGGSCPYWEMESQIKRYHTLSFGNGNLESPSSSCVRTNIRNASRASGYRLVVTDGSMTTSLSPGIQFTINLNWQNIGITPTYEKWNVVYELRNSSNQVIWSGTSSFKPQMFLPQGSPTLVQDNFTLPVTVAAGSYSLVMLVKDPNNYRKPLPLAIQGRNTDGSYLLSAVTVAQTTQVKNKVPIAHAGQDKTIMLPSNSLQLDGTASSDSDGAIVKYRWSQVGGPGTASFTDHSAAAATVNNLLQGVYSFRLTVTDDKNDTAFDDVSVSVNAEAITASPLSAVVGSSGQISCYGGRDGTATVVANGGKAPYTYSWNSNPVQSAATATNLSAGSYTVVVKDADQKSITATVTLVQPDPLAVTATPGTISVHGGTTSVSVNATGGTAPYSFTGPTENVSAGSYSYAVKDARGCTASTNIIISQPAAALPALTAVIGNVTNVNCYGATNGSAIVTASGGKAPYSYSWNTNPVQTGATVNNLSAGSYTVIVKDADQNATSSVVTITQPEHLAIKATAGTIALYGGTTSVTLNASGGTSPYSFTGPTQNVFAGTYSYTVKDANGCTAATTLSISEPAAVIVPLTVTVTNLNHVSCNGGNNGSATVAPAGGKAPYSYSWNSNPAQTGATANNLSAGSYTVVVKDADQKTTSVTLTINEPAPLSISAVAGIITRYGGTTTVNLSATGGTAPYQFSGPTTQVTAGTYTYTVNDSKGCSASTSITIDQPKSTGKFRKYTQTNNSSKLTAKTQATPGFEEQSEIKTYPNPASQYTIVEMTNELMGKATMMVVNMNGTTMSTRVIEKQSSRFSTRVDISGLTKGSYILKFQFENGSQVLAKFIKL